MLCFLSQFLHYHHLCLWFPENLNLKAGMLLSLTFEISKSFKSFADKLFLLPQLFWCIPQTIHQNLLFFHTFCHLLSLFLNACPIFLQHFSSSASQWSCGDEDKSDSTTYYPHCCHPHACAQVACARWPHPELRVPARQQHLYRPKLLWKITSKSKYF